MSDMENKVLIVIDTLSALHLPIHGYERDTAPFLTELAKEGTYFNFGYSTAPWTVPSHASIFSGLLPKDHRTHTGNKIFDSDSFVENLNEKGYDTIGFSNNELISEELGFSKGFNEFKNVTQSDIWEERSMNALNQVNLRDEQGKYNSRREKYSDFLKISFKEKDLRSVFGALKYILDSKRRGGRYKNFYNDSGAAVTNKNIKEKLKDQGDNFFLFVNYVEPHLPFAPPKNYAKEWLDNPDKSLINHLEHYEEHIGEDYWWEETSEETNRTFRALYDAEIKYIDSKVKELYDWITSNFENTAFYITSDHGELIGEHGLHGHQIGIWEENIRVPVIISGNEVDDREINRNFSLRKLGKLIQGAEIEDTVTNEVYSEYYGLSGINEPSDYEEDKQKYLTNTSKSIVSRRQSLVENTDLEDVTFTSHKNGRKDPEITQEKKLRQKIKQKFNDITEGLDF
jgi:arylsulfatase A-like enzyme